MIPGTTAIYGDTAFLNLTSNAWTTGPSLITARYYHTCSVVTLDSGDKEIVVVGGMNQLLQIDGCTSLRDVEIINVRTNEIRAGTLTIGDRKCTQCITKIMNCRTEQVSLFHKISHATFLRRLFLHIWRPTMR